MDGTGATGGALVGASVSQPAPSAITAANAQRARRDWMDGEGALKCVIEAALGSITLAPWNPCCGSCWKPLPRSRR